MSTAKLLFRGSGLRVFAMLLSIASSFLLVPFVIHTLGDHWYGLWVLIGSFFAFYRLLDVGVSSATQRYLAHAVPRDDPEELNSIIAASLMMFCGVGLAALVVTGGLIAVAPLIVDGARETGVFRQVSLIMGAGLAISFPFYTQFGILTANLRFDYTSYIQMGKIVLRTGLFFLVLGLGYGLVALALTQVAVDLLGYVALVLLARTLAPWLKLKARHFTLSKTRELVGFGLLSFAGTIANTARARAGTIIAAGSLGLVTVTHFNIADRLNGYFFRTVNKVVPNGTSIYSRYFSKEDYRQIRDKFLILSRLNIVFGVLGCGAVILFARPFITLWVGPQYLDAFIPLCILMVSRVPIMAVRAGAGIFQAMARQKVPVCVSITNAVLGIAFGLLLAHWYGLVGMVLGLVLPTMVTRSTISPLYLCHIIGLPRRRYYGKIAPVMLVAAIAHLPLWYLMTQVEIDAYWQIVALGAGYYLPWLAFFYLVMLTKEEQQLFREALPWTTTPQPAGKQRRA